MRRKFKEKVKRNLAVILSASMLLTGCGVTDVIEIDPSTIQTKLSKVVSDTTISATNVKKSGTVAEALKNSGEGEPTKTADDTSDDVTSTDTAVTESEDDTSADTEDTESAVDTSDDAEETKSESNDAEDTESTDNVSDDETKSADDASSDDKTELTDDTSADTEETKSTDSASSDDEAESADGKDDEITDESSQTIQTLEEGKFSDTGHFVLDSLPDEETALNFRFMDSDFDKHNVKEFGKKEAAKVDRTGLDDLRISASACPNISSMNKLYETISERAGEDAPIYIIDLRQEYHGYINNRNVSWYEDNNWGNLGKDREDIISEEKKAFDSLKGKEVVLTPKPDNYFYKDLNLKEVKETVQDVVLEEDAAEKAGFKYIRYTSPDHGFILPEYIDEFLSFYQNLPDDAWLHFHCRAGKGRTGVMCAIVDMIENRDVPYEDILSRQYLLGGANLMKHKQVSDATNFAFNERTLLCEKFYEYIHDGSYDEGISWTDYLVNGKRAEKRAADAIDFENAKVSFLGPEGTYTQEACGIFFDKKGTYLPYKTVEDAIEALENGDTDYCVIPQENTIGGAVTDYLDIVLSHQDLSIIGEVVLPINQNLLVLPGTELSDIKKVYSHKQGLAQGKEWLEKNVPDAEIIEVSSTAEGAKKVSEDEDNSEAAIASAACAEVYGLEILEEGIQNNDKNKTRFYVLKKNTSSEDKNKRMAFIATGKAEDLPDLMSGFKELDLELVTIHERPEKSELGKYNYIIECDNGSYEKYEKIIAEEDDFDYRFLGLFDVH